MIGEELAAAVVTSGADSTAIERMQHSLTRNPARSSAQNPRKWGNLFDYQQR